VTGWRGYDTRPPWWPETEPFPPPRHRRPTAMQRRFYRRMFFIFIAVMALVIFGAFTLFWSVANALGFIRTEGAPPWWAGGPHPEGPAFVFIPAVLLIALLIAGRMFRGVARPVGDLIEAAGRVEAGGYDARVPERGPREMRSLAHAFNAMTARLEANESQRKQLLADVTHELRTPLTVMQGNVEALLDGVRPLDREHIATLLEETKVLARLIDDLRTLSLTESGALALHREPVEIASIARDVVRSFSDQAQRTGVSLGTTDEGPTAIEADPVRVREILTNLVSNAMRYTPAGGAVGIEVRGAGSQVEVTVRDTGTGIAPDAVAGIFDRFSKSTDSPGAGLGLAIAKGLVDAHGGAIRAESVPGQGTRVVFTLPARAAT
jgi:two-component system OmpR family sensor kinase/two-component system sensor histidine kinase BaeS